MTYPFEKIVIIYNPKSTGEGKVNAEKLISKLEGQVPAQLELLATERAGHAEQVAASYAKKEAKVLLVSSSGDGGYHELINGVLSRDSQNICSLVLPSGNANDHHQATASRDLASRIIEPKITQIDALKISAQVSGQPWQRYAHSYAGIGLTAYIGQKMTEADLNPVNEKVILLKYLLRFGSVVAKLGDKGWHHYSSLLFGNIDRMSKVLTLGENSKVNDGQFEVYSTRASSSLAILGTLLIGSLYRLKPAAQVQAVKFTTKQQTELQCDGEVFSIDGRAPVTVEAAAGAIRTLV